MRASVPRHRKSCIGARARRATEDHTPRMRSQEISFPERARYRRQKSCSSGGACSIPAQAGVIIVCAAVGHAIGRVVMGQKWIVGIAAEGKLEDLHPRQLELIAQRDHIGGDFTEILGNDRQISHGFFERIEEMHAGTGNPTPDFGGGFAKRALPNSRQNRGNDPDG